MSGITGVMLNWKRPDNVARIVAGWRESGLVDEGIVWNNNPDVPLTLDGWARVINPSHNFGLYMRFAAACLAKNECVLIQDDDICLPTASLIALYEAWRRDPEILHGAFGRMPDALGLYVSRDAHEEHVPIVLTQALLTHRRHAAHFFEFAPAFDELQRDRIPYGNGEDIIFSYAVMRQSGRLNRTHRIPVTSLPEPHALNLLDHGDHLTHRTAIMHACQAQLLNEPGVRPGLAAALARREPLPRTLFMIARRAYFAFRRRMP